MKYNMENEVEIYDKIMERLFKDETEFHILGEDSIIKKFYLCIRNNEKVATISEMFGECTHQYSGLLDTNHYDKSRLDICYYKNNVGDSLYGKIGDGLSIPRELILCDDCTAEVFRQVGNVNDRFTLFLSVLESDEEEKSIVRFIVKDVGSFYLTNTVEVWMKS
jgi:hypothetical protein